MKLKQALLLLSLLVLGVIVASCSDPTTEYELTVDVTGDGTITSDPAGINCGDDGDDCDQDYAEGVSVTLSVAGGTLTDWGGACEGTLRTSTCTLEMTEDQDVSVTFEDNDETGGEETGGEETGGEETGGEETGGEETGGEETGGEETGGEETGGEETGGEETGGEETGGEETGGAEPVNVAIAASADDAEEYTQAFTFNGSSFAAGDVSLTSSDLELNYDKGFGTGQVIGLRFTDVNIPAGATISDAYIEVQRFPGNNGGDDATIPTITITAQTGDALTEFVSQSNDISSRPKTNASVAWQVDPFVSGANRTPNLASVITEAGGSSGTLVFILTNGTTQAQRSTYSYDNDPALAPRLIINFEDED